MPGQFMSRLGRVDELGRLYIGTGAPPAGSTFLGGTLVGPQGPAIVNDSTGPARIVNGKPVDNEGKLCVAVGQVVAFWAGGLPFASFRSLCIINNAVTTANDTFIDKLRFNAQGQLHTVNVTPPVFNAFSNGFSTGFGL